MIEDANIVEDIRRIRHKISAEFEHDIDRYIDYLQMCRARRLRRKENQTCRANKEIAPSVAATSNSLTEDRKFA